MSWSSWWRSLRWCLLCASSVTLGLFLARCSRDSSGDSRPIPVPAVTVHVAPPAVPHPDVQVLFPTPPPKMTVTQPQAPTVQAHPPHTRDADAGKPTLRRRRR